MTVKVVYCVIGGDIMLDLVSNLQNEAGWQPCYITTSRQYEDEIRQRFPAAVLHNLNAADQGVWPDEFAELSLESVDQNLIEKMLPHEITALKLMDRMDPYHNFHYQERKQLYYKQLSYWYTILQQLAPELIMMRTLPHFLHSYMAYAVGRSLGIQTIMFEWTSFPDLIYLQEDYQANPPGLKETYQATLEETNNCIPHLSPRSQSYLSNLRSTYDQAVPAGFAEIAETSKRSRLDWFKSLIKPSLNDLDKRVNEFIKFSTKPVRRGLKVPKKTIEESTMTGWQYMRYRLQTNRYLHRLQNYYDSLTGDIDLDRPFIYVPLHLQPEETTLPKGGWFVDQLLMISMLCQFLPDNWALYVKEHPIQFADFHTGHQARSKDFYDELVSHPSVRLVPRRFETFQLIDNSRAVATVTGTAGWEAVVRGIPSLVFGYAWYRECDGVFYVPDNKSCKDALDQIAGGYRVDPQKVDCFVKATEEVCIVGAFWAYQLAASELSHEQNINNLTKSVTDFFEKTAAFGSSSG